MELRRVAHDGGDGGLDPNVDTLPPRIDRRLQIGDHGADQTLYVARGIVGQLLPPFKSCQTQQVVDEPLHARRVPGDDLEEAAPFVRIRRIAQGLDVSPDGGERRAQLVRHVGDEIPANLIRALQVGDVVQDEHRSMAVRIRNRRGSGHRHARAFRDDGRLDAAGLAADGRQLRDDRRMADDSR